MCCGCSAEQAILQHCNRQWTEKAMAELEKSANVCMRRLNAIHGVDVVSKPQGAMYVLCEISSKAFPGAHCAESLLDRSNLWHPNTISLRSAPPLTIVLMEQ